MKTFREYVNEGDNLSNAYSLVNNKKDLNVEMHTKFSEVIIKTDKIKYLSDFIERVNKHLRTFKLQKIVTDSGSDVYEGNGIRVQYDDFKGEPKAIISKI
jgi:hypothetical protein